MIQDIGDEKLALDAFRKALVVNPHLEKEPELVKTLTERSKAAISDFARLTLISDAKLQAGTPGPNALLWRCQRVRSEAMKSLMLAGAMIVAAGTTALADGGYWVVGNRATAKCEIVTSNPVVNAQVGGNIWFGSGPYQSSDDAKLARSTIGACPKENPPATPHEPAPANQPADEPAAGKDPAADKDG